MRAGGARSTVGSVSNAADDDMAPGATNPMDFLAALLRLSPKDAERVRNATPPPEDTNREHGSDRQGADD